MRAKQILYRPNQPIHTIYFPDTAVICQMTVMADGDTLETATVGLEGASWISASIGAPSMPCETVVAIGGDAQALGIEDLDHETAENEHFRDLLTQYSHALLIHSLRMTGCTGLHTLEQRCARWILTTLDRVQLVGESHPVADGAADGRTYRMLYNPYVTVDFVADPVPGVTGDETGVVRAPTCAPTFYPAPEAAEGRTRMLRELAAAGARAISDLALLLPARAASGVDQQTLFSEVGPFLRDPGTQPQVFDLLSEQGVVSYRSIHTGVVQVGLGDGSVWYVSHSVNQIMRRFLESMTSALQLGVNDEDWRNLPGFLPAVQQPPTFIGPATLTTLTVDLVHDPRVEQSLLGYMGAASRAAAAGDLLGLTTAMDSYIAAVKDGTTNTLMVGEHVPMTAADAWTLEVLARAWVTPLR